MAPLSPLHCHLLGILHLSRLEHYSALHTPAATFCTVRFRTTYCTLHFHPHDFLFRGPLINMEGLARAQQIRQQQGAQASPEVQSGRSQEAGCAGSASGRGHVREWGKLLVASNCLANVQAEQSVHRFSPRGASSQQGSQPDMGESKSGSSCAACGVGRHSTAVPCS